ncbi:hypothetical protein [Devosia sp.]|nr:hypothetical protein [Devosia sp.]
MRVLLGTVIGLGMARLLVTIAGIIQHPHRAKLSALHLLWVGSMLLELLLFWWWEFALFKFSHWNFGIAVFLVAFAILLFLIAALLSPDNLSDYRGYEDFFIKRRKWFFGLFAAVAVFDVADTLLKGTGHWEEYGGLYFVQAAVGLSFCALGAFSANARVHLAIVIIHLMHQATMAARFFYTT